VIITIPEALREKLGPDGARALAELLNEASVQTRGDVIEIAVSRFERRLAEEVGAVRAEIGGLRGELDSKIGGLRGDLDSKIAGLRGDLDSKIAGLRGDLDSKIGDLRADMSDRFGALEGRIGALEGRIIRWMFVFWIGQFGALLAIFFAFFRG